MHGKTLHIDQKSTGVTKTILHHSQGLQVHGTLIEGNLGFPQISFRRLQKSLLTFSGLLLSKGSLGPSQPPHQWESYRVFTRRGRKGVGDEVGGILVQLLCFVHVIDLTPPG